MNPVNSKGQLRPSALRGMSSAIEQIGNLTVQPPLELLRQGTGYHLRVMTGQELWGRITGPCDADGNYPWTQVVFDATGFRDVPQGFVGTANYFPAAEANGNEAVLEDTAVRLVMADSGDHFRFQYPGCDRVHKVVTGVVTSGGVSSQSYAYICWPSGEILFTGCEELDELDCEQPTPPPVGSTCCLSSALEDDLTVTLSNPSCGLISDPTTFPAVFQGGGAYSKFWVGGVVYVETQTASMGGDVTHYCCTAEAFIACDGMAFPSAAVAGTTAYIHLRYWKVLNQSATSLTYDDLIALLDAGDEDTQVCTIGIFSPLQGDCFTTTGQNRSATGLVFNQYTSFPDCETAFGASPCCETDGATIDVDIDS